MVSGALAPGVITTSAELVDELDVLLVRASDVTCGVIDIPSEEKGRDLGSP